MLHRLTSAAALQFGTSFQAVERRAGRVTQGLWVQTKLQDSLNVLLFDIEGCGGVERRAAPDLERQLGVLALTAADVVILNINNLLIEHAETLNMLQVILQVRNFECLAGCDDIDVQSFRASGLDRNMLTKHCMSL